VWASRAWGLRGGAPTRADSSLYGALTDSWRTPGGFPNFRFCPVFVCFTPESGPSGRCRLRTAYDPFRTWATLVATPPTKSQARLL
jgi:hypothetical protein